MKATYCVCLCVCAVSAWSEDFVNLSFEDASLVHLQNDAGFGWIGPAQELLPGWRVLPPWLSGPPSSQTEILGFNLGLPGLGYGTLYDSRFGLDTEGRYGVAFFVGYTQFPQFSVFDLIQTGDVPLDAKSIHFVNRGGAFELRVDGTLLPLLSDGQSFAADISPFAGRTAELDFRTVFVPGAAPYHAIDDVSFSPVAIPEPPAVMLLFVGWIALWCRQRVYIRAVSA